MPLKLTNNAISTLASAILPADTSLTVQGAHAGRFPILGVNDFFPLTLADAAGNIEIVKCTARAGALMTIVRAQEGTAAKSFPPGAVVELRATAATLEAIPQGSMSAAVPKHSLVGADAFAILDSEASSALKRLTWTVLKGILDAGYAAKVSAALEGTPSAPTPLVTDNSTRLATTAFVKQAVTNVIAGAPGALDTLNELAAALGDDANFATTMTNALAAKLAISAKASQAQAEAGTDNTAYMTPLRTKQAINNLTYQGTSPYDTNYPVGHVLVAHKGAPPYIQRNATGIVRLSAEAARYEVESGSGAILSGLWRARGMLNFGGDAEFVMQRVA